MVEGRMAARYFDYLTDLISEDNHPSYIYQELLQTLFDIEFYSLINNDQNRMADGLDLRFQFGGDDIYGPCSVLEMMVALSLRMESDIMFDPDMGDRAHTWFWLMIKNLGLEGETDDYFNENFVRYSIDKMLTRTYQRDGKGGLFYIKNGHFDMRKIEIWYQMNYFINEFLEKN